MILEHVLYLKSKVKRTQETLNWTLTALNRAIDDGEAEKLSEKWVETRLMELELSESDVQLVREEFEKEMKRLEIKKRNGSDFESQLEI